MKVKNQAGYILVAHMPKSDAYIHIEVVTKEVCVTTRLTGATIFNSYSEVKDFLEIEGKNTEIRYNCKIQPWRINISPV